MTGEKCELSSAREAADALREVSSRAEQTNLMGQEPAEALAELARVAGRLGRAVEDVAGDDGGGVRETADRLATAIAAQGGSPTG